MADVRTNGVMAVIRATRPSFRNKHDKVAFAVHATFLNSGYYLTAAGPPAYKDDALTSSSSSEEVGINRWNEIEDEYGFVYASAKGSKKVLVKCLAINNKLVVDALKDGAREPVHIEIDVDDFAMEGNRGNYSDQYKNLEKLVKDLSKEILSKFHGSSTSSSAAGPARVVLPPVYPGGYSDVYPGPPPGSYPTRGGFMGDGSMLIGPNDPRFFGPGDRLPPFSEVPPPCSFRPIWPPEHPRFRPISVHEEPS